MTTELDQPPGQLAIWPPTPSASSTSYRVVHLAGGSDACPAGTPRWSAAIRDLPLAAARAAVTAERHGEAWLVAADFSSCHVDAAGAITPPPTGWAALAARVITQRKAIPS